MDTFKSRDKLINILRIIIIIFFGVSIFSIFSFSGRHIFNYVNIVIVSIFSGLIILYLILEKRFVINVFIFAILAFAIIVLLSPVLNFGFSNLSKSIFLLIPVSILIYQFSYVSKDLKWILLAILIGGTLFCIYYLFHYRKEIFSFEFVSLKNRLGDYFDNQNSVSRYFAVLGLLSASFAVSYKKWGMTVYSFIMFFFIMTTGSISNLLTYAVSIFILFFAFFKKRGRIISVIATIAFIAVFWAIIQIPSFKYFHDRIVNIFSTFTGGDGIDSSALERFEFAVDGFTFFLKKPLFGNGPGGVMLYSAGGFSHNNFIELLANYGLFGFIFYELLVLVPLFYSFKLIKTEMKYFIIIGANIYLFLFQFFLVTYYLKIDFIIIALSFSIIDFDCPSFLTLTSVNRRPTFVLNKDFLWPYSLLFKKNKSLCDYYEVII